MDNYFFVDGSALLGDVRKVRIELGLPATARLKLQVFVAFFTGVSFEQFHGGSYRRFVFYFVQDDEHLRSTVEIPDFTRPCAVGDLRIEFCGKRIRQFQKAKDWLEQNFAPEFVRECLYRSEKAVDTQICCDALQLAATGKLDRLFLYTNDYDFVPLCRTLRQLGANINLFRLRGEGVNAELVGECDAFHAMMGEDLIRNCFDAQTDHTGTAASGTAREAGEFGDAADALSGEAAQRSLGSLRSARRGGFSSLPVR